MDASLIGLPSARIVDTPAQINFGRCALHLAALLRGQSATEQIQLYMQCHPEPPFDAGTPDRAPPQVLESARNSASKLTADRLATAKKISARLGVRVPGLAG